MIPICPIQGLNYEKIALKLVQLSGMKTALGLCKNS